MKRTLYLAVPLLCILVAPSVTAQPSKPNVVPGESLGRIRLGFTMAQVRKALGKPDQTLRLKNGLTDDLYRAKKTRVTPDGETVRDKLEVLYKGGRVVQIEATSPVFVTAKGLSVASTLRFLDEALKPKRFLTYGYGGGEVGGYMKYYVDQVRSGIAFESSDTQDDWAWDVGSKTIIVHRKGVPVIPDQDGELMSSSPEIIFEQ